MFHLFWKMCFFPQHSGQNLAPDKDFLPHKGRLFLMSDFQSPDHAIRYLTCLPNGSSNQHILDYLKHAHVWNTLVGQEYLIQSRTALNFKKEIFTSEEKRATEHIGVTLEWVEADIFNPFWRHLWLSFTEMGLVNFPGAWWISSKFETSFAVKCNLEGSEDVKWMQNPQIWRIYLFGNFI